MVKTRGKRWKRTSRRETAASEEEAGVGGGGRKRMKRASFTEKETGALDKGRKEAGETEREAE